MECCEDDSDYFKFDTLGLSPELKLLNYLNWVGDILNREQSWNIDTLCFQIEHIDLDRKDIGENLSGDLDIFVDNAEVKKILLSDSETKDQFEVFTKVLLRFLTDKIENFQNNDFTMILQFVNGICFFVKAYEENNITTTLKARVTKFLFGLFSILETAADGVNLIEKGPLYQLIAKIIGTFKTVEFAKSFITIEISKKLKTFYSLMAKTPKDNFDMSLYEVLLLYLMILKEVLEFNFQQFVFKPCKISKKEDNTLNNINDKLTNMIGKLPDSVELVVRDCLNLLS